MAVGAHFSSQAAAEGRGRPQGRQVAFDGSPGPHKCEYQLFSVEVLTLFPSRRLLALQPARPCIARWHASIAANHDASLPDAAENLALTSIR